MSARSRRAHPASRTDQLAGMADEYVLGRAFGHNWQIEMEWGGVIGNVHYTGYATVVKQCRDCPYKVTTILDGQMGIVQEHRETPPGYAIKGQGRGEWRKEARREALTRFAPTPQRPRG